MGDILFLAHRIPFPPDRGDKIRSWQLIRYLAGLGRVHLACFADDDADAANLAGLREALGDGLGEAHVEPRRTGKAMAGARALAAAKPVSLTLFDSPALRRFVEGKLAAGGIDTVFAFSGQMGQFVPDGVRARFIMDFGDVDSAKFAAYAEDASGLMRWLYRREAARLFTFERAVAGRADVVTFVSEAEAALFRGATGLSNIRALSNGIDFGHFDPAADFAPIDPAKWGEGPILLFTGQMDYPPNIDAVRWFVREVLPLVPDTRFVIAGRAPTVEVQALAGECVIVTGAVDDMRSWLAAADVVVAPLRIARGIQNKVLEAMAMARPVVASPAAFEGIEAEPGRDLIVANDAASMAREIADLLVDRDRAVTIGQAARALVAASYGWDARLAPLPEMIAPDHKRRAA